MYKQNSIRSARNFPKTKQNREKNTGKVFQTSFILSFSISNVCTIHAGQLALHQWDFMRGRNPNTTIKLNDWSLIKAFMCSD